MHNITDTKCVVHVYYETSTFIINNTVYFKIVCIMKIMKHMIF